MDWNYIVLLGALIYSDVLETQCLQEVGWLSCDLVEEETQLNSMDHAEVHYNHRNAVLQFGQPESSAVDPNSITFFVTGTKVDMRKYIDQGVEELQCEIRRYSTGGIEVHWPGPGPGPQVQDTWFTCTLRHSGGLFVLTTFLRYTSAQEDYRTISDADTLITTAVMLVLTRSPSVKVGLLREQTLHCQFAVDHKKPDLVLEWRLQRRGERSKLFSYTSRSAKSEGKGVSLKGIAGGQGSLHLPATTMASEGTYICSVYVPPLYGSHDVVLHILESPKVSLNVPASLSLQVGGEQKVVCDAQGYYPLDVQLDWLREQQGGSRLPEVLKNVLFSSHRHHPDGTYSLSAFFLLHPTSTHSELIYTCRVSHSSLHMPIRKSFTLTVTEPANGASVLWGAMGIGFVVITIALLALLLPYLHKARREVNKRKPY